MLASVGQAIAYERADEQKLDLYLSTKRAFTAVVFTNGGGWHLGIRKSVATIGVRLRSHGFGSALLSHRLAPKDRFAAQIERVPAAVAWVKRNIPGKGGSPQPDSHDGSQVGSQLSLVLASDPP
jgi:acetyl esterase/lipase